MLHASTPLRGVSLLLCATFLLLTLQNVAAQAPTVAEVRVLNTSSIAGKAVADVVLPVPRGLIGAVPRLKTSSNEVCQVKRMGASWPDGTIRYLRVHVPVTMKAGETRDVPLQLHIPAEPQFRMHDAVAKHKMTLAFRVGNTVTNFPPCKLIEDGHLVRTYRSRLRVPGTPFWAEAHFLIVRDLPYMRFYLQWGNSDPRVKSTSFNPGEVALYVRGAKVVMDEEGMKVLKRSSPDSNTTELLLHNAGKIGDGQSQAFEGRLILAGNTPPRLRAMAKGWARSGTFGPFGNLFPGIPVDQDLFHKRRKSRSKRPVKLPWSQPIYGCRAHPGGTGPQEDFGSVVMREDVLMATPSRLEDIARSVLQEACRPTHFREVDLSPVTIANHPKLLLHLGRPHWRAGNWVDTLGKPRNYGDKGMPSPENDQWIGHDPEHWSVNYLCLLALITGDLWARQECEHKVELWLGEFTTNSGTGKDTPGAARALGRSLLAGCWLYLVTGRQDLKERILGRVRITTKTMGRERSKEASLIPGVLAPRWSQALGHYWVPWEEGMAATGLYAVYTLFGSKEALGLAVRIGDTAIVHGFGQAQTSWRCGYRSPFATDKGGVYVALFDTQFEKNWSAGRGLTGWGLPAALISHCHTTNPLIRQHADRILKSTLIDRPIHNWDDAMRWMAILQQ